MQTADSALRRDATTALCGDVLGGCGGSSQAQGKAAAVDEPLRTAMTWNQLADRTGGAGGWEPAWPESAASNRGGGVWASDGSARVGAEAAESARLAIRAGPRFIPLVAAPAAWVRQPASAVAWAADAADGAGALRVLSTRQLPCPGPDYTSRARAGGGQLSSVSRRTSRASRTGAHRLSHTAAVLTVQTADETRSRRGVCATIPAA